jgi:hypothetical protein
LSCFIPAEAFSEFLDTVSQEIGEERPAFATPPPNQGTPFRDGRARNNGRVEWVHIFGRSPAALAGFPAVIVERF